MANEQPDLRIGDAERDDATQLLTGHMEAGRLDQDEFTHRVQQALGATHESQLGELFRDLPGRRPGEPNRLPASAPVPRPVRRIGPLPIAWWVGTALLSIFAMSTMLAAIGGGHLGPGMHRGGGAPGRQVAEHAQQSMWWLPLVFGLLILIGAVGFFTVHRIRHRRPTSG